MRLHLLRTRTNLRNFWGRNQYIAPIVVYMLIIIQSQHVSMVRDIVYTFIFLFRTRIISTEGFSTSPKLFKDLRHSTSPPLLSHLCPPLHNHRVNSIIIPIYINYFYILLHFHGLYSVSAEFNYHM